MAKKNPEASQTKQAQVTKVASSDLKKAPRKKKEPSHFDGLVHTALTVDTPSVTYTQTGPNTFSAIVRATLGIDPATEELVGLPKLTVTNNATGFKIVDGADMTLESGTTYRSGVVSPINGGVSYTFLVKATYRLKTLYNSSAALTKTHP